VATHQPRIETSHPVPPELDVGTEIVLKVKVSCPQGCDLSGAQVKVMASDEVLTTSGLSASGETTYETEDFPLNAPAQVGTHTWTILFPRHDDQGVVHEESRDVISVATRPHATSMAVWGVPSPVVMNRPFTVKVGVKCSPACQLTGQLTHVCDEAGTRLGEGRLGDTPWPGTSALYVAEVQLVAPATEGIHVWSAIFAGIEAELAHDEASSTFSVLSASTPEHRVTVKVTDKETDTLLENVSVRLGVYSASTDRDGRASLDLPKGIYELDAWKVGYEIVSRTVDVGTDLIIHLEASPAPEMNPDDERVWM
jgi:hypothetical protein